MSAAFASSTSAFAVVGGPTCSVPDDYANIAAALADPGCTTIVLDPGAYNESNLSVTRPVAITGPNAGIPAGGIRGAEAHITSGNDVFVIGAAGALTVNGLKLTATDRTVTGSSGSLTLESSVLSAGGDAINLSSPGTTRIGPGNAIVAGLRGVLITNTPGGHITVIGNAIDPGAGAFHYGIRINNTAAGMNQLVRSNTIVGGGGPGISTGGQAAQIKVAFNRLFSLSTGIEHTGSGGALPAENNWFGCNGGPPDPDCVGAVGNVDFRPWLVMRLTSAKNRLHEGEKTRVRASFLKNSAGDIPKNSGFPDGVLVAFAATKGTITPVLAATNDAVAKAKFKATQRGRARITATLDGQERRIRIPID